MFLQQFANALVLGSVYALFALGFTLIFGVLEVITLAHGAVFMIGAFAGLTVVTKFNASFPTAILVGMMVSGVLGWLIDLVAVRPLRKRKFHHLAPMIATIGCATIIISISQGLFGAEIYRFPFDFMPATSFNISTIQLSLLQVMIIGIALFLMLVIIILLNQTKWGKAVRVVAENPRTAALLGIPVERVFQLTAFTASALGGAAGVLTGINFREEKAMREKAMEILELFHLAGKAKRQADSLSYGEQRKLELARALATSPKLLLVDEPAAGMNPSETEELMGEIVQINNRGYTICLIEHDMKFVMGVCRQVAVLNFGELIALGSPDEVKSNSLVIEAYLGKDENAICS